MRKPSIGTALLVLGCASAVSAQSTTNCMNMGGGIVNCNTVGPQESSTTNCVAMGRDMATCNTTILNQGQQPDSGVALGQGIANLIGGIRERNFRKRIGRLLADGDCEGAARHALEKGRLEVGLAIRQACVPPAVAAAKATATVEEQLQLIAERAQTPSKVADNVMLTAIEARGRELVLTARWERADAMPPQLREDFAREICAEKQFQPLLLAGASVRAFYLSADGVQIAADEVTASSCGLI